MTNLFSNPSKKFYKTRKKTKFPTEKNAPTEKKQHRKGTKRTQKIWNAQWSTWKKSLFCVHLPSSFAVAHFYSPQRNISYLFLAHFLKASKDSYFFFHSFVFFCICFIPFACFRFFFFVAPRKTQKMLSWFSKNFTSYYSRISGLSYVFENRKKEERERERWIWGI